MEEDNIESEGEVEEPKDKNTKKNEKKRLTKSFKSALKAFSSEIRSECHDLREFYDIIHNDHDSYAVLFQRMNIFEKKLNNVGLFACFVKGFLLYKYFSEKSSIEEDLIEITQKQKRLYVRFFLLIEKFPGLVMLASSTFSYMSNNSTLIEKYLNSHVHLAKKMKVEVEIVKIFVSQKNKWLLNILVYLSLFPRDEK